MQQRTVRFNVVLGLALTPTADKKPDADTAI